MIKPPSMISPDPFQGSASQNNLSPSLSRIGPHCAIPNDPSNAAHQRPPSVARTPTTPLQNASCSFPFADDVASRTAYATPSPNSSRHQSTPVDQRFQNDSNSLRKLQQLTYEKDSVQNVESNAVQRKISGQGTTSFSPSSGSRRQRYQSVGVPDRPSSVTQPHLSNAHASFQTAGTPPDGRLRMNTQQQYENYCEVPLKQRSAVYNKDFPQRVNFVPNQGLHAPAPECPWPAYPPNLSRQQSAPPYSHFSSSVHEQSRIGLHQYQQYGPSGVNFPNDRAFSNGLQTAYQHQPLISRPSREYSSAESYYHHNEFGPPGHMQQGDGASNLFNSGQALAAYSQQTSPYYGTYGSMYK